MDYMVADLLTRAVMLDDGGARHRSGYDAYEAIEGVRLYEAHPPA